MRGVSTLIISPEAAAYDLPNSIAVESLQAYAHQKPTLPAAQASLTNCIIDAGLVTSACSTIDGLQDCFFFLLQLVQDFLAYSRPGSGKCLVFVIHSLDAKKEALITSFLEALLKSVQVESKYAFRYVLLCKKIPLTAANRQFIVQLLGAEMKWFVNNRLELV
jgi:hypothetical protein